MMKKKIFMGFSILCLTIFIVMYIFSNDVKTKVGAFRTELSKKMFLKSSKTSSPTATGSIANPTKIKKEKKDNANRILNELPIEDLDEFQKDFKVPKRTAEHEITAEELEEFHEIHKDNDNDEETNTDIDDNKEKIRNKNEKTEELLYLKTPKIQQIGELKQRFPHVIIAGVKKCGTRALLSFLAKHPLVKSAGREIHFFDKNDSYSNGLDWYLEQMPQSYENDITIEKTPGYYVKDYVPKRIYDFSQKVNKEIKLIFIFRDPVERAISDYTQTLANRDRPVRFEKLIFSKTTPKTINARKGIISIGLYAKHLWKWLEYFPKVQMHFVNGDEFIKNPVPSIIAVQKFLNIPVFINKKNFVYNATKNFYCFRKLGDNNKIQEHCLGESKGRKHPPIKDNTRRKLTKFYRPHNEKFFEMIGKNFGWPTTDDDEEKSD